MSGPDRTRNAIDLVAKLAFYNRRAEVWWRFREALDPDQEGGSAIALPPDDELKADLASAQWELTARGIKLTRKQDLRERIGRSPRKGDAVVMAWAEGAQGGQAPAAPQPTARNPWHERLRPAYRQIPKPLIRGRAPPARAAVYENQNSAKP